MKHCFPTSFQVKYCHILQQDPTKMEATPTLTQRGLNLYLKPENRLSIPCIFLGNALPFFFQSLAEGTYVDITLRAALYAFKQSPLQALANQQIKPIGKWVRAQAQKQIDEAFKLNELAPAEQFLIKNIFWLVGLDPNDLLSDKALIQAATKIALLTAALFAISTFTGTGLLPLFWAYQRVGITCAFINFGINLYHKPEDYPLTWAALRTAHVYMQEQAAQ